MDLSADGLGKMTITNPSCDPLDKYLPEKNAGKSVTGLWHSSFIGAVCHTGHTSDSSQARFDGGDQYFRDVEFPVPPRGESNWGLVPEFGSPWNGDLYFR